MAQVSVSISAYTSRTHLLVVDDDARICNLLTRFLEQQGYWVTSALSTAMAEGYLRHLSFDFLILDIMMPKEDGLCFARRLRAWTQIPILLLTALSEPKDRIAGLEAGGDDYLTKPFEPRELVLRIENILRRQKQHPSSLLPSELPQTLAFGPFTFCLRTEELRRGIHSIYLTPSERNILSLLAQYPNQTLVRDQVLGKAIFGTARRLDVQITRLRKKIEVNPSQPRYLKTIRHIGYRLFLDGST